MTILAIDPGPVQSAWLALDGDELVDFATCDNEALLSILRNLGHVYIGRYPRDTVTLLPDAVVIEQVASYGMAVGREVFETVYWSGRFAEAAWRSAPVHRLPRMAVKLALCHDSRAKDANIRQALIDRYGGGYGKALAIGTKARPGKLYGVTGDVWAALAVAVTFADATREKVPA